MARLNKKSVDDINVKGKRVLCRCDFNTPMKEGKITDDNRIRAALPTIKKLMNDGAKLILCSHLGKPKGTVKPELTLAPIAERLSELLGTEVKFVANDAVVGDNVKEAIAAMKDGEAILLQNTRFRPEEEKNVDAFSEELASLCDIFVMDAFGTVHRAHCTTAGVAKFVPETAVGYLMLKEIEYLGNAVEDPVRPFVAVLGGAKVADKLNVISRLLEKCDSVIIGGGMAYTFLKAKGYEVGASLVDDSKLDYCKEMVEKAEKLGKQLLLPVDTAVAAAFPDPIDADIAIEYVDCDKIPADKMGLDIGPKSMKLSLMLSRLQRLLSGTDRWAYLRIRSWLKERSLLQRLWQRPMRSLSWAAATPQLQSRSLVLPTRSPWYPPAAAHPWSTLRDARCPVSPLSRTNKFINYRYRRGTGHAPRRTLV